ncbi:uncharacterized protein CIMG_03117 [Coccidioides immitis RS]|uniref:Uncharacterized protein n=1 Tax=Coccidioides immitis (strain RS) TaxID=246410 RepID=J3KAN3_COCIM|nr:uncharacterized protein CIMG_03117 [Coccidioides immitis RS]EAS32093.3 hypothetical protein CIMG_03117 [Coccidioides immitis RS]
MTLQGRFKLFQPTASFRAKLVILLYWNRAGKEVLNELSIVIFIVKDSLDCFKVGMKSASGSWERQSIPHAVGLGRKMDQRCDLGSNDRRLGEYLGTRDGYHNFRTEGEALLETSRAAVETESKQHNPPQGGRDPSPTNGLEPEVAPPRTTSPGAGQLEGFPAAPITRQKGAAQLLKREKFMATSEPKS